MNFHDSFITQGKEDLKRSEILFEEGDIGGSIFSAQQALEKYLKAYLIKANIFSNPKKMGHLPFGAILGLVGFLFIGIVILLNVVILVEKTNPLTAYETYIGIGFLLFSLIFLKKILQKPKKRRK